MTKKRWIILVVALLLVLAPIIYFMIPRPAPVRFEPEQLVFTESGTQTMKVLNESDEGVVLHLQWDVASSPEDAPYTSCYAPDSVYLMPGQEKSVEVEIHLHREVPTTVTPKSYSWNRAMRIPGTLKTGVPSMRSSKGLIGGESSHYLLPQTTINCYYVHESDRAMWVSIDPKLEPKPDDLYVTSTSSADRIEPGEVFWYEVAIKPSSKIEVGGGHSVTLVVDVEEYLWKPERLPIIQGAWEEYRDWASEREKTPTNYPVELTLAIEKPDNIELREDYIIGSHHVRLDTGERFSKTLHFLNYGPSSEIEITATVERISEARPDIPIEVSIQPPQQVFWRRKVTSVDLEIRAPDMEFDREMKYNYYYSYWNKVTLKLTVLREVSDEEGPVE